jgi:hypothetical protein
MKTYPEISVTGFARRRVCARFRYPELKADRTAEELESWRQISEQENAAIRSDPDTNLGADIENALNVALKRAFHRAYEARTGSPRRRWTIRQYVKSSNGRALRR